MKRPLVLVALGLAAIVGCIGPSGSHREGYKSPTAPPHVPSFDLVGLVREQGTGKVIEGAKIDVGISSGFSNAQGRFSLPGLRGTFFQIVTSREGYDTVRTPIMPFDGTVQVSLFMTPSASSSAQP